MEKNKNQENSAIEYKSMYTVYGWLVVSFTTIPFLIVIETKSKAGIFIVAIMFLLGTFLILIGRKKDKE
ncbi:MAG: hypothetical protein ABII20_07190 [Candidatus Omnitrophota bacterium]|nr:hypothetical protein [Candidatus Omnitrophota bacterium]MBU3929963.1 hypothetical protein [bacterium]